MKRKKSNLPFLMLTESRSVGVAISLLHLLPPSEQLTLSIPIWPNLKLTLGNVYFSFVNKTILFLEKQMEEDDHVLNAWLTPREARPN